jgi:Family of unknown function (DUF5995)
VGVSLSARTIGEVLEQLDEIVDLARRKKSRLGYFAALYRNVTIKVNEGILAGSFEDVARMERLDVAFANCYLDAFDRYHRDEDPSKCWGTSFRAAQDWHPIVLQHLLLGVNAHINLDLGIAAAQAAPGTQLSGLRREFDSINDILGAVLADVQDKLTLVSPLMTLLDSVSGRTDEAVMNFSIRRAREAAWRVAERLAPLGPEEMHKKIDVLYLWVDVLASVIQHPPTHPSVWQAFSSASLKAATWGKSSTSSHKADTRARASVQIFRRDSKLGTVRPIACYSLEQAC